jgi:hypothetical protein
VNAFLRMISPVAVSFLGFPRCPAQQEKPMLILRTLGAVIVLAGLSVVPVQAQQVMSEPGYCAFFYPNANCMNKGPGNPYTDPSYRRNGGLSSGQWSNATASPTPKRTRKYNASARM